MHIRIEVWMPEGAAPVAVKTLPADDTSLEDVVEQLSIKHGPTAIITVKNKKGPQTV